MAEMLPPAVQEFILDAAGWVAGIDKMVAEDAKLDESIRVTEAQMKSMAATAAETASASAAAMARNSKGQFIGGSGKGGGGGAGAAAAGERELSAAEKAAAEAAKVEADMLKLLAESDTMTAETTKLLTESMGAQTKAMAVNREAAAMTRTKQQELAAGMSKVGGATIAASAAFAGYGLKAASDYQAEIVKLKTSAGETGDIVGGKLTGNIKTASDELLKMSVSTATSTHELTAGMYMVESAGYGIKAGTDHAADGLNVLRVAAQGARAEQAPLKDVTNALTTVMRDFNVEPQNAAKVMNTMTVAVGKGKMTMDDFASAIGTVSPIAHTAGISFGELAGMMATLTQHGATAHGAVDDLTAVIRGMTTHNMQAVKEMDRLGLSATDVEKNLGKRGLMGTLELYTKAIAAHTKGGQILIDTFNKSKTAAADAQRAFSGLPPNVQKMATSFINGSISAKDWVKYTMGLPPLTANLANQFATAEKKSRGFSDLLRSSSPMAQSYATALSKMLGGTNAYRAATQVLNDNLKETQGNIKATTAEWDKGDKTVKGFAEAQQTLKYKLDQAKESVNKIAITVGTALIPPLMKVLSFFQQHSTTTKVLAYIAAGFLAIAVAVKAYNLGVQAVAAATKIWTGIQWLLDAALNANPISLIVIAIAALVAAVIYCYFHFKAFRDIVNAVFNWLKTAVVTVIDFVKSHWELILAIILGPVALAAYFIHKYWDDITGAISAAVSWVIDFVKNHWGLLVSIIGGPLGLVIVLIIKHWDQIKNIFAMAVEAIKRTLSWFAGLGKLFYGWLVSMVYGVFLVQMKLYGAVAQIPGKILSFFSHLYNDMLNIGHNIIIGIWNGLVAMGSWLYHQVTNLISSIIPGPIKHVLGIASPSKLMHSYGQNIAQGLVTGMTSKYAHVHRAASDLAKQAQLGAAQVTGSAAYGGRAGSFSAMLTSGSATAMAGSLLASGRGSLASTVINISVTVNGSIITQRQLENVIQTAVLKVNVRNPQNNLSLASGR